MQEDHRTSQHDAFYRGEVQHPGAFNLEGDLNQQEVAAEVADHPRVEDTIVESRYLTTRIRKQPHEHEEEGKIEQEEERSSLGTKTITSDRSGAVNTLELSPPAFHSEARSQVFISDCRRTNSVPTLSCYSPVNTGKPSPWALGFWCGIY